MYLPKYEASKLFREISQRFNYSQFVLDMAPERYTKEFMQAIAWQFKLFMGIYVPWVFGVKSPPDLELFGEGFKVIDDRGFKGWFIINALINEKAQVTP